ncbi:MAG: MBL fold metallo-hydrolase [Oscillospiraceae bacterium]|nr:MBL fold metallo-hydrolase [Oscillospiraceae bacterium]
MYELIPLRERSFVFRGPTNVGIYIRGDRATVIDSGATQKDAAALLRTLDAHGWKLETVLNTHYHADHIGGNAYLQDHTGCRCFSPAPFFAQVPLMNAAFLFYAEPPAPLRGENFLVAGSRTEELTPDLLPAGFRITSYPGHCYEQYAIRTPDDILFVGDVLLGYEELQQNTLFYFYSYPQHMDSLDRMEQEQAHCFVPSHGSPVQDVVALTDANRAHFLQIREWILEFCAGDGMSQDELMKAIFDRLHRHLHLALYSLSACSLHAYLSALIDERRIIARAKGNMMRFRTI